MGCRMTMTKNIDGTYTLNNIIRQRGKDGNYKDKRMRHVCNKDHHEKEETKYFRVVVVQNAKVPGSGTPRNVFESTSFRY